MTRAAKLALCTDARTQNAVADHVVWATQGAAIHGALDDESYVRAATGDLPWTRRENGDPAANCGHFGGTVLSEDPGWGADR
jgi:hypothetical protein